MQEQTNNSSAKKQPPGTDAPAGAIASPDGDSQDSSDEMNTEELAAFNKIMGEIEAGDDTNTDSPSDGDTVSETIPDSTDDFSVELEKRSQAADAGESDAAGKTADDAAADELDEDQQKAFETIMAQIEGGDNSDADISLGDHLDAVPDPESSNGFSAELEKDSNEAAIADGTIAQAESVTQTDDARNGEQRDGVEDHIPPIDNGGTDDPAPDSIETVPTVQQTDETAELPQENESLAPKDASDEVEEDISDDINDLLKEIASTDEAPQLQQSVDLETVSKADIDTDAGTGRDGDSQADHEPETEPQIVPEGENSLESFLSPDTRQAEDQPHPDSATTKSMTGDSSTLMNTAPLREATKPPAKRKKSVFITSVAVIFCIVLVSYHYWSRQTGTGSNQATLPSAASGTQDITGRTQPVPQTQPQESASVVQGQSDRSRLETAADNLELLRKDLIAKQAEIDELRAYYQSGIDAEMQGIADSLRSVGKARSSYQSAQDDPRISLGLAAIQRREVYIQKLGSPTHILTWKSEELLFFYRKAELLSLMSAKTSDIDVDGFLQQVEKITNAHRKTLAELNIDAVLASPRPLESIWQDVANRLPRKPVPTDETIKDANTANVGISKEICAGEFAHKGKLTVLNPETARCLAYWKGKDLFLNALTDLAPDAARHLAEWEGEWLGLNGLKELPAESAIHLSRWKGKGLSLNGLSRLSPRVVAILSEWQGDQIELINVKHMAHWENPNTRLFLSEDLNRKFNARRE